MRNINISLFKRVSLKEKVFFSKQLATMMGAGLQLASALRILRNQTHSDYFKEVLTTVVGDLEQGKKFSEALARFPNVFNRVYINIVFAGENSGRLDKVLKQLGEQLGQEKDLVSRLRSAMIYPSVVLVALIGVAIFSSVKVIPSLASVFADAKHDLPWTTQAVLGFSNLMINYWYWLILGTAAMIGIIIYLLKTPAGGMFYHHLLLKEPLGLYRNIYQLRFCRTLGSLLESGVPIIEALNITAEVIGNDIYRDELKHIATELEKGVPLSVPVGQSKLFPYFVSQMLIVGEKTGQTDKILINLASYFHKESTYIIDNLSSLFEPAVIILIGLGVAVLVFAILVPIYQYADFVG